MGCYQSKSSKDFKIYSNCTIPESFTDILSVEFRWVKRKKTRYLFLHYLNYIFIMKNMGKPAVLRVMPCTSSPYKNILHILDQTSVYMIAEVLY